MKARLLAMLLALAAPPGAGALTPLEELGKLLFFDPYLSANGQQACASCHSPDTGFTGPSQDVNLGGAVYQGSLPGAFGDRKPTTAAYATQAPILSVDDDGTFTGGSFWDGRATGEKLGNPAADQAQGPFLNPKEHALPDAAAVVARVCDASRPGSYADRLQALHGPSICDPGSATAAYDAIARAIAAYEASPEVNAFSSKLDAVRAGKASFTAAERRGRALFDGKAKCAECHPSAPRGKRREPPLFTDYSYDNLGLPANPRNPASIADPAWRDPGLGGFLRTRPDHARHAEATLGAHKVPTLRNVDRRPSPGFVKAYGHNGVFKSLEQIVHFYNTRDVLPACAAGYDGPIGETCWPPPEVAAHVNRRELGNLKLTAREEADLVAFLRTLSDGWQP